jgi:hypothetical protein
MKLETLEDVTAFVLPIAPTMSEDDVKALIKTVHEDPTAGQDLLAAYQAASAETPPDVWAEIWNIIQQASNVAGIITSLYSAAALL